MPVPRKWGSMLKIVIIEQYPYLGLDTEIAGIRVLSYL